MTSGSDVTLWASPASLQQTTRVLVLKESSSNRSSATIHYRSLVYTPIETNVNVVTTVLRFRALFWCEKTFASKVKLLSS